MDKYRPSPSIFAMFTSDSQHPPRSRHAVYLGGNTELFSMKKCINLANFTFNLYVLHIKLAHNTEKFRRLVLENFITVIHFLFGRKGILWASTLGFWAAEHLPPPLLCQQATSIQCVKYGNTSTSKSFCWHAGVRDDILKNVFYIYIF